MQLRPILAALAIVAAIVLVAHAARDGSKSAVKPDPASICPTIIDIISTSEDEVAAICRGAQVALDVLATCGLRPDRPIKVEVSDTLDIGEGLRRRGDFTPSLLRVRLVARDRSAPIFFGTRLSMPEHYASVAAHEIAHAIFAQNAAALDLPITAHEYVAYVVQMKSFSEAARQRVLARDPPAAASNLFLFSFFLLYADPDRFAVNAFAHFARPENGCAFLDRVLRRKDNFPPATD